MSKEVCNAPRRLFDAWDPRTTLARGDVPVSIKFNIGSSSVHLKTTRARLLRLPRQRHVGESTIRVRSLTLRNISIALGSVTILGGIEHTTISDSIISGSLLLGRNFTRGISPPFFNGSVQEALGLGPRSILMTSRGGRGGISFWDVSIRVHRRKGHGSYRTRRWRRLHIRF